MHQKNMRLKILDEFQCIGSDCPDNCCSAPWRIDISIDTVNKWKTIQDEELRDSLLKSVHTDTKSKTICFTRNDDNSCFHLKKSGLCSVHADLGESYLPDICKEYPKLNHVSQNISSHSLTLSCPEVVRLLITQKDENIFSMRKKPAADDAPTSSIPHEISKPIGKYMSKVLIGNFPVNLSLIHIAQTLCEISYSSRNGSLTDNMLSGLHKGLDKDISRLGKSINDPVNKIDPKLSGQFWKLVFSSIPSIRGIYTEITGAEESELLSLLSQTDADDGYLEELHKTVMLHRKHFYKNIPGSYLKIMRRYLRVKFNNSLLSTNPYMGNIIASYMYCALPYAAIQILCWSICRKNKTITDENVIKAIYKVERLLGHSDTIYEYLDKNPSALRLDYYYRCLENV